MLGDLLGALSTASATHVQETNAMKTITADPNFLDAIKQISEPTEIVDRDGKSIAAIYPHKLSDKPLVDLDTLRRLRDDSPRSEDVTTQQLLERLKSQGKLS